VGQIPLRKKGMTRLHDVRGGKKKWR